MTISLSGVAGDRIASIIKNLTGINHEQINQFLYSAFTKIRSNLD